jgi:ArsR family transcriptional regulator
VSAIAQASRVPGEPAGPAGDRPTIRAVLDRGQAESLAALLRTVSDPTRLQILGLIHRSPAQQLRVADLATELGLRAPTISHHLKVLAEAGVVTREPRGREAWFAIREERISAIADILR